MINSLNLKRRKFQDHTIMQERTKKININTVLQIVALIILIVVGYLTFKSSANWKLFKFELENARKELRTSIDTLTVTKQKLANSLKTIDQLQIEKDLIRLKRDSIIMDLKRKNAKDWEELTELKDSISKINDKISEDLALLRRVYGLDVNN